MHYVGVEKKTRLISKLPNNSTNYILIVKQVENLGPFGLCKLACASLAYDTIASFCPSAMKTFHPSYRSQTTTKGILVRFNGIWVPNNSRETSRFPVRFYCSRLRTRVLGHNTRVYKKECLQINELSPVYYTIFIKFIIKLNCSRRNIFFCWFNRTW